jgi:hypothetical protein
LETKQTLQNQNEHFSEAIQSLEKSISGDFGSGMIHFTQMNNQTNSTALTTNEVKSNSTPSVAQAKPVEAPKANVTTAQAPVSAPVPAPAATPAPAAAPASPVSVADSLAASKAAVMASQAAVDANKVDQAQPPAKLAETAVNKSTNDYSIETSKLDDSNFDNLGHSSDPSPEERKAAEKPVEQEAPKAEEKKEEVSEKPQPAKDESNGGGITIETSSLADPFDTSETAAPKVATPAAKDDKPKDGSKIQLNKHKKHKKHRKHKKHHKRHHERENDIPDMVQISQIRDIDNSEIYGLDNYM